MRRFLRLLSLLLISILFWLLFPGFPLRQTLAEHKSPMIHSIIEPALDDFRFNWSLISKNPVKDQLLCLSLEDAQNLGSELFHIMVFDASGHILFQTWDVAVSAAYWLNPYEILYFSHDSMEMNTGKGIIWNLNTHRKICLFPELKNGYQATYWDAATHRLLFTLMEKPNEYTLHEWVQPSALNQSKRIAKLPFLPYRIFPVGTNHIWLEHPESHGFHYVESRQPG
jgi:hypothetical protein